MGTYIYGIGSKYDNKKVLLPGYAEPVEVGHFIYLAKCGWGVETDKRFLRRCEQIRQREVPDFVVVTSSKAAKERVFYKQGDAVQNYSLRTQINYPSKERTVMPKHAVMYDDPWGFGPIVGFLQKIGRTWRVVNTRITFVRAMLSANNDTEMKNYRHTIHLNPEGQQMEQYELADAGQDMNQVIVEQW